MTKELPVGISAQTGRNKGYRLNRTVRGKEYNFGTFQNINHAIRTNGYIDIIVGDLKEAQEKEGIVSVEQVRRVIQENSLSEMHEIAQLIDELDSSFNQQLNSLKKEVILLHHYLHRLTTSSSLPEKEKTFWQRILKR